MPEINRLVDLPLDYSFFLFGPRQVGKSTLVKQKFSPETTLIYNLLDFDLVRSLTNTPKLFKEAINSRDPKVTHVFVDEVQKLPWLLDEVHSIIENEVNPPYFILTGSSARKLKRNNANMLAGRALERNLYPFVFPELKPTGVFSLQKVLEFGSLPLVYTAKNTDLAKDILRAYTSTYIKEEIKQEALVRNLDAFIGFLSLVSAENGGIINYNNIAEDIGLSINSVKEYYQILEDTLMGFKLQPIRQSIRQRIVKSPKFYFFDTGVVRALSEKLSSPLVKGTKEYGDFFEAWLIKEIVHLSKYLKKDYRFSFYRTDDVEVDLIVETPDDRIIAIEIKSSDYPKANDLGGLVSLRRHFPDAELYCACPAMYRRKLDSGIMVMPWQEILEVLGLS
jgi:predicted AAA+ superfamily ATPase